MTYYAYSKTFDRELEVAGLADDGRVIYENAMPAFAELLQENIEDKRQNIVPVCGGTGSGKSMTILTLIKLMDPYWRIEPNLVYTTADLADKISKRNSANPITMMDEGTVILGSKNAMTRGNKDIGILFDTMRSLGWTTFIAAPQYKQLDRSVRDIHSNYLLLCPSKSPARGYDPRGFVTIYEHETRDWGAGYFRPLVTTKVPLPPKSTRDKYEKIKLERQLDLLTAKAEALA